MDDERHVWTVERAAAAASADFGYARGRYASSAGGEPIGYYLRVWRREAGTWKVALEIVNPAPPGKPA